MACQEDTGYCIKLVQGATFKLSLTVTGIDLTGASADMKIRGGYPDYLEHFSLVSPTDISITVTTPVTNQIIVVTIPDEDLEGFTMTAGLYDLFVTLADGSRRKILKGSAEVETSLPRP